MSVNRRDGLPVASNAHRKLIVSRAPIASALLPLDGRGIRRIGDPDNQIAAVRNEKRGIEPSTNLITILPRRLEKSCGSRRLIWHEQERYSARIWVAAPTARANRLRLQFHDSRRAIRPALAHRRIPPPTP